MGHNERPDLIELISNFEFVKRAEGKSPNTIRVYDQLLRAFYSYVQKNLGETAETCLTINTVRQYILYLHTRPKFQGHPFTPAQSKGISVESVRDHVRTLKAFSSWVYVEGYTKENRLVNLKLPKPERIITVPLSQEEIEIILNSIDQKTPVGRRNYVIVFLMLDTGLRLGEITSAVLSNFNSLEGYLKVMGKGRKERIVPLGRRAQVILSEYITYVRSKVARPDCTQIFVSEDGGPVTYNSLKLFFTRLKKETGITRVHAHLLRHTFAINYLLNGGDIYSLKEILGHETLEMVNHYLHFTKAQITARHREFSPMDRIFSDRDKKQTL